MPSSSRRRLRWYPSPYPSRHARTQIETATPKRVRLLRRRRRLRFRKPSVIITLSQVGLSPRRLVSALEQDDCGARPEEDGFGGSARFCRNRRHIVAYLPGGGSGLA